MLNILKNIWRTLFTTNDEVEGVDNMDMSDKIRKAARAQGRVQGVGFRFFTQSEATKLRLTGWVKNLNNGDVTMEVQGAAADVEELISRLKKGNGFSKVASIEINDLAVDREDETIL